MVLQTLSLTNFRNYPSANFTFSPTTTLVVGPNTAGKTNLLEAMYFLATGRSFQAGYDREMIRSGEVFTQIKGIKGIKGVKGAKEEDGEEELEITILANENGENTSSKRLKVNGVKKRMSDFVGNLRAVYFGPEEILLVTGSPSKRRKFMDAVLCQVDREYARTLLEYEKVLRQRNRLLLILREKGIKGVKGVNEQLDFWDERLEGLGSILSKRRGKMMDYFNRHLGGGLRLLFEPRPWSKESALREREIAAGMTLWGPHRDDFRFMAAATGPATGSSRPTSSLLASLGATGARRDALRPRHPSPRSDLAIYGSRGEQRLAVLQLKLAELEFITKRVGERPVLLLDDIFSELDENNRGRVLSLLGKQQTIITTTDIEHIDGGKLGQHKVLRLQ